MLSPITTFIGQPNVRNLDSLIDRLITTHDESFAEDFVNKTLLIDPQTMDDKVIKAYQLWKRMDVPSYHRLYKGNGPDVSASSQRLMSDQNLEHKTELLEEKKEYSEKIALLEQECRVLRTQNDELKALGQKIQDELDSERSKNNVPLVQAQESTEQRNELDRLSKQNSELRAEKENITHENTILNANLEEATKKLEIRESELQELQAKLVSSESEIKQLTDSLSQEKKIFEDAKKKLSDELAKVNAEIERLHSDLLQLQKKSEDALALEQKARADFSAATMKIQSLQTELSENQATIDSLKHEKDSIVSELSNCQKILPASVLQLIKNTESGKMEEKMIPVLYSLMTVVSHDPIEDNDFLTRFNALDRELYAALSFNESLLEESRKKIQTFLNAKLKAHKIQWDLIGLPYDEESHMTDDSKGNTIVRVLSALITGPYSQRATVKTSI